MADLYRETQAYKALVTVVREALGDDEQAILDTLEGATTMHEALAATIREANVAAAMRDGLTDLMGLMKKRAERLNYKVDRLYGAALFAMQELGIPKVTAPDMSLTVGKSQGKVVIVDQERLPKDCFRAKYEINRSLIRDRLLTGVEVPGAELSNGDAFLKVNRT